MTMSMWRLRQGLRSGWMLAGMAATLFTACGGNSSSSRDLGADKTTLTVEAEDADGDPLQYEWRVTAGSVENRNARSTVWTLPAGPGLHFAYVTVSDGKGGYAQQQYAVSSDALEAAASVPVAVPYVAKAINGGEGSTHRLRFTAQKVPPKKGLTFANPAGGAGAEREVYLPDVQVELRQGTTLVFSGRSDWSGEVNLPRLADGTKYQIKCARSGQAVLSECSTLDTQTTGMAHANSLPVAPSDNLRLHGHLMFRDGGVCGAVDEYSGIQSAGTVQLLLADGTAVTPALRINRYGDYALTAAVPVKEALKLQVRCDGQQTSLTVPVSSDPAGYVGSAPVELSAQLPNSRPRIEKVVANGPEGNVRGRMVMEGADAQSNQLPGPTRFLSYKGMDTRRSACAYYKALGAAEDCDAQGQMLNPISLDDWRKAKNMAPYAQGNAQVRADYINKMDLNLVRRMEATQTTADDISFVVCNHPGPEGSSQAEVDEVMRTALDGESLIACVAMEWSISPGANGGKPFTKFLTFGSDGRLMPSVNLDGRGEKYLPGACIACHGGSAINGRFPDSGSPSPFLGSRFLPFDTGNYDFSSAPGMGEADQSKAIYDLNQLVKATERDWRTSATTALVKGWYPNGSVTLNKAYVPPAWITYGTPVADYALLYREVVGSSCRTCHAALGEGFDWDFNPGRILRKGAKDHICGGEASLVLNATMPNALISRDRVAERVRANPTLLALVREQFGCDVPMPDPVYPRR